MSTLDTLTFEWDPEKARRNRQKHRVSFELACEVWNDPLHIILPDRVADGEERWHAIGLVGTVVVLVVVHSYPRGDDERVVRIIGARKATRHERWRYEQQAFS